MDADPFEWTNLATKPEHQAKLNELRAKAPKDFKTYVSASPMSVIQLAWHQTSEGPAPASKHDGGTFDIYFFNQRSTAVTLYKMSEEGEPMLKGKVAAGAMGTQTSGPGEIWQVNDASGRMLGYFVVDDRSARGMIPAE